jgi:hypothetical protein
MIAILAIAFSEPYTNGSITICSTITSARAIDSYNEWIVAVEALMVAATATAEIGARQLSPAVVWPPDMFFGVVKGVEGRSEPVVGLKASIPGWPLINERSAGVFAAFIATAVMWMLVAHRDGRDTLD